MRRYVMRHQPEPTRRVDYSGVMSVDAARALMFLPQLGLAPDPDPTGPLRTGYDSSCAWCWLGHSHSELEHAESVASTDEHTRPKAYR